MPVAVVATAAAIMATNGGNGTWTPKQAGLQIIWAEDGGCSYNKGYYTCDYTPVASGRHILAIKLRPCGRWPRVELCAP